MPAVHANRPVAGRPVARPRAVAMLIAVVGTLALAGCVGGEKPATRFYVLSALGPDAAPIEGVPRDPPLSVDIAALRLPRYLQRPQIVTRSAGNELKLAEYHQWGGSLAKNMMRVLARDLSTLLATPEVSVFSRRPPVPADVRVEVDVLQFERGPDRRVVLSARWRLRGGADRAPRLARITDLRSPPVDAKAGMDATVAAMSALVGEFSRQVAVAVAENAR